MGLLDQLTGVLGKYADPSTQQQPPAHEVESDFDETSRSNPELLQHGLAGAFRSDQTPGFGQMVSQLFSRGNPQQRTGIVSTLLGSLGSGGFSQLAGRGLGIGNLLNAHQSGQLGPEHVQNLSPEAVEQMATHAQQQNPNVVDHMSGFFSQHPGLIKTLGLTALTVAMAHMAKKHSF
jgi:hypothetical protein